MKTNSGEVLQVLCLSHKLANQSSLKGTDINFFRRFGVRLAKAKLDCTAASGLFSIVIHAPNSMSDRLGLPRCEGIGGLDAA